MEHGHRLCKHPENCRFPHGHSLRIEIVVRRGELDDHDMVCDYKAIKIAVRELVDRLDHAMALNSEDPELESLRSIGDRVIVFSKQDPTTEVLARWLFDGVRRRLAEGGVVAGDGGAEYPIPPDLVLERIRIWETRTSWAEYVGTE